MRKRPVLVSDLKRILAAMPDATLAKRDRAILLVGFAGAFRRSELAALDVADLEEIAEGLAVTIHRS